MKSKKCFNPLYAEDMEFITDGHMASMWIGKELKAIGNHAFVLKAWRDEKIRIMVKYFINHQQSQFHPSQL